MEREEFLRRLGDLRDMIQGAIETAERAPERIPSPVPGAPDITRPDYSHPMQQLDLLQDIRRELWRLRADVLGVVHDCYK